MQRLSYLPWSLRLGHWSLLFRVALTPAGVFAKLSPRAKNGFPGTLLKVDAMRKLFVGLIVGVLVTANGCGQSDSTPAQQASSPTGSATPPTDPVALVAYNFFDAVLASDRDAARAQLTSVAVQRMAELGMDFLLPISESSKFSVGEAVVIEEGMAAVDTVLTEVDATTGQPVREEITVVLRLDQGKWGVMGVVTGMGQNEQLDGFNFEKPDQPFTATTFDPESKDNIAGGSSPSSIVPQQAARPAAQDPFRQ